MAYYCNDDDDQDEVSDVLDKIIQFKLKQALSMQTFPKSILKERISASLAPDSETVYNSVEWKKGPSEPRRVTAPHWVAAESHEHHLGNTLASPKEAGITTPVEMELY